MIGIKIMGFEKKKTDALYLKRHFIFAGSTLII